MRKIKEFIKKLRAALRRAIKPQVVFVAAVAAIVGAIALVPPNIHADNQGFPTTFVYPTNMPATISAIAASNSLASYVPIFQGRGLAMQWQFNVSSGLVANVVYMSPSVDGTNASGLVWPLTTPTANSNTVVTASTNWSRGSLDGYLGIFVIGLSNGCGGTLTNKGLLFVRPNN